MVSSHTPHALDPKLVSWVAGSPRTTEPRADVARDTLVRASRVWAGVPVGFALASELPHEVATETRAAVLSWVGSSPIARRPSVAIVGTRRLHGVSGTSVAEFLHELVPSVGLPVVSGGALGVDTVAHRAALEAGLPVTVVIAGGLCHPSPASNRADFRRVVAAGGTVVSDRPPAMPPARHDFVRRNRLIAALADVVVVAAAPEASGALATARYAAQLGRVVLAVPGAPRIRCSRGITSSSGKVRASAAAPRTSSRRSAAPSLLAACCGASCPHGRRRLLRGRPRPRSPTQRAAFSSCCRRTGTMSTP